VLVRYVAVFYLVVFLELEPAERRRVLALVLGSAALQGVLGVVQHLQGGASEFWLPRADLEAVAGVTREFAALDGGLEQGAVLGTTDHSVAFALFLLVGVVALALTGFFFSYVRAALFAFGVAAAALVWMERRTARSRELWLRAV